MNRSTRLVVSLFAALTAGFFAGKLAMFPAVGHAAPPTIPQATFEFKVIAFAVSQVNDDPLRPLFEPAEKASSRFEEVVNILAKDGWEYVGIVHKFDVNSTYVLFRRTKPV